MVMSYDQVCDWLKTFNLSSTLIDAVSPVTKQNQDSFKCCNLVAMLQNLC